ncbi:MAG: SNase-like nuclease [Oscillatoriales cyanobacterium]|uniref:thermonuclease family protein n=1 Tax=unclassified Microcoleus TaxID=2642155 RepID=UPI001DC65B2E|nr:MULTISPECIES: thermonuclease family protein [unclassified Microcoleus]TAF00845.1 MAG: SNase-like nuclease [Oscillatoriales cyanobacterium]MCC3459817.1 thermonuclease family protein [Microcoleus sp. PH2017_11_PCY_U_A]MCC3478251.1 thermonuclease family protein [Microcoleus sp. PH2017_12_PCY_D_A]TAF21396.1 MAG: SNase-like nuclease [Oscillatoriales cyanobacterium]TAF39677.1 MAG: SNase-like nuclease [Oscillatoriales cyanobacterium]
MIVAGTGYLCYSKFIFDGDTLNLDFQGEQFKARLQWIDSPESRKNSQSSTDSRILKHWEWAEKAKTTLANLVAGKPIVTIPIEKDSFNRWVCDCYLETVKAANNVQIQLCKAGMAATYLPFNRFSYSTRELAVIRGIITETANANRKKRGIWSEPNFILPYEFKKLTI